LISREYSPALAQLTPLRVPPGQTAHRGHGDVRDGHDALSGARLEVGPDVALTARLARRPVHRDPLTIEVHVLDRDGNGLFPAEPGERKHHGDIAKARLEVVERFGQAQHLRNARDDNAPAG
jgi:hypothetical protein